MNSRTAWLALALGLPGPAAAVPLLGPHHYPWEPGTAQVRRITVSGAIVDPAAVGDPGALSLALYGDVVLGQAPAHAGWTLCGGRCQMPAPTRSLALYAEADTRVTVIGAWSPPAGSALHLEASALVVVRGPLAAPSGGLTVHVSGPAGPLPRPLLSADAITGPVVAGTLPAGTRLTLTPSQIYLESVP